MRPLQILDVHRRGKILLMLAWIGSVLCSLPQVQHILFSSAYSTLNSILSIFFSLSSVSSLFLFYNSALTSTDVGVPPRDAPEPHLLYPMYNVQHVPVVHTRGFLLVLRHGHHVLVPLDRDMLHLHQYFCRDLPEIQREDRRYRHAIKLRNFF